jgi:polar amino acid transport system substrate-binding protein
MTIAGLRFCALLTLVMMWGEAARAGEALSFGIMTAAPYGITREDNSISGSNHDIAEVIAEKAGVEFTFRLEPLPRLISDLKVGRLDVMIMFPTDETRPYAIAPIMPNNTVIIPTLGQSLQKYDDLKGKTIAGLRGAVYDQQFSADESVRKYDVDTYVMGLRMTTGGRVDGIIGPDFGLFYQMKLQGMRKEEFGAPLVINTRMLFLLASSKVAPDLVQRLKAATDQVRENGAIAAAASRYAF